MFLHVCAERALTQSFLPSEQVSHIQQHMCEYPKDDKGLISQRCLSKGRSARHVQAMGQLKGVI